MFYSVALQISLAPKSLLFLLGLSRSWQPATSRLNGNVTLFKDWYSTHVPTNKIVHKRGHDWRMLCGMHCIEWLREHLIHLLLCLSGTMLPFLMM